MARVKVTWVDAGYLAFRGDDYDASYRDNYLKMMAADGYHAKPDASVEFEFDFGLGVSDENVAELVFSSTNRYAGELWAVIEPLLPPARPHTALSMGDFVEVDGKSYRCEPVGFKAVS